MCSRANSLRGFKTKCVELSGYNNDTALEAADWEAIIVLRGGMVDNYAAEREYRHMIGSIGDIPMCVARWRHVDIGSYDTKRTLAVVDYISVLEAYRNRGLAKALLESLLLDVKQTIPNTSSVLLILPMNATQVTGNWVYPKLIARGFSLLQDISSLPPGFVNIENQVVFYI
jgi:GNAT superfamily N-acetyltransferase